MNRMIPFGLLIVLALCGFGPAESGDAPEEKPVEKPKKEKDAYEECKGMDMTDTVIQSYIDGTVKAAYWVQIHDDPAKGQYWTTSYTMAGLGTINASWCVAKVDGETAVVENKTEMIGDYSKYRYVVAYEVNLAAEEDEANVNKAWVGKLNEKPTKITVMEKSKQDGGGDAPNADYEMTEEDFADMEMAGAKWSGTLTTIKGDDWESKTWVADGGWFGGMIKSDNGGFTTELTAFGDDAKPELKWADEEEKKEPAEDEGKDETEDDTEDDEDTGK